MLLRFTEALLTVEYVGMLGSIDLTVGATLKRVTPTLFHEGWWLDAATGGNWEAVELADQPGIWIPIFPESFFGMTRSRMPVLTHFLGPVAIVPSSNAGNRSQGLINVTQRLINQLPRLDCFRQTMHGGIQDVLAFQMEGYTAGVQFTFVFEEKNADDIWMSMRDKLRNGIRNAQRHLNINDNMPADAFVEFYRSNERQHRALSLHDLLTVRTLIEKARSNERGQIYAAFDASGDCQAAIFCAWDNRTTYYLMSTRSQKGHSGAVSLLLWHVIQLSCANSRRFDFDGVAFSGSAPFFASFGARCEPRYVVSKLTNKYRALRTFHYLAARNYGSLFDSG